MVIRTYFDKNNTVIYNKEVNTARSPVTELFYGGPDIHSLTHSRYIFHFDCQRLIDLYNDGTYPDLTKLTHTLLLTNTGTFDKNLLTLRYAEKQRTSSFDLELCRLTQFWDEGVGFDSEDTCDYIGGNSSYSEEPSNYIYAQTALVWSGSHGPTGTTIANMHFDQGNENIKLDITDEVNGIISGATTNYGYILKFKPLYESLVTDDLQYAGFFSRFTNTFYEPCVQTEKTDFIDDNRLNFFLDKPNKLYLYSNLGFQPANLTSLGCTVYDEDNTVISAYTSSAITQYSKGVYYINLKIPTSIGVANCKKYYDSWTGTTSDGLVITKELEFTTKDNSEYYNIGNENDIMPKKYGFSVHGVKMGEQIIAGNIRKVLISARKAYTSNHPEPVESLEYRIYTKEGTAEYTIIDYTPVNRTYNSAYFLLDTASFVPNVYFLDIRSISNLDVETIKNAIYFIIVNQADLMENVAT